jgi:hypothetical protein
MMIRSFTGPLAGLGGSGSFGCSLTAAAGGVVGLAVADLAVSGFALTGDEAVEFFPTVEDDCEFFATGVVDFGTAAIGAGFVAVGPLAMAAKPCVPLRAGAGIALVVGRVTLDAGGIPVSSFAGFVIFAADFAVGLAVSLIAALECVLAMVLVLPLGGDSFLEDLREIRPLTFAVFVLLAVPRDSTFRSSSLLMASHA